jgi:sugar/nucleoside kinase (ribokinase family)
MAGFATSRLCRCCLVHRSVGADQTRSTSIVIKSEDRELFRGTTLCVVGNVNRDVRVHQAPGSDSLLQDGETAVPAITETVGGGGANSACAAAALGGRVHFVGKIGADALGRQLQHALERHGVKTSLTQDSNCVTGTTVALGFETGRRHFLSCLPNNQTVRFEDLDLSALGRCQHLLRADVWFSLEMLETGNERLLLRAHERGLQTSLDINYDPVWSRGPNARSGAENGSCERSFPWWTWPMGTCGNFANSRMLPI